MSRCSEVVLPIQLKLIPFLVPVKCVLVVICRVVFPAASSCCKDADKVSELINRSSDCSILLDRSLKTWTVSCFREEEFLKRKDLFRRNAFLIIKEMVSWSKDHPSVLVDEVHLKESVIMFFNLSFHIRVSVFLLFHCVWCNRFSTASSFWERLTIHVLAQMTS